jgi:hypothetical protein
LHLAATEDMQMDVGYRLSTVFAGIDDVAKTLLG